MRPCRLNAFSGPGFQMAGLPERPEARQAPGLQQGQESLKDWLERKRKPQEQKRLAQLQTLVQEQLERKP